jgi:hypothetical protein
LESNALAEPLADHKARKDMDAKPVELDAIRLKSIEILLRKALPDLSSVTVKGDPDEPLVHRHSISDKIKDLLDSKAGK